MPKPTVYEIHAIPNVLTVTSIVTIHYFEFAKDYIYHGESHDFWEMVYADRGEIIATADGDRDVTLRQGEALFHKPLEFHKLRSNGVSAPNVFVISFVCRDEAMRYFEGKHLRIPNKLRPLISDIILESQSTYRRSAFDPGAKELVLRDDPVPGGPQIIRMRLEELLLRLLREGSQTSTPRRQGRDVAQEENEDMIARIIEIIRTCGVYGSINLNTVCSRVNYGKTYICTRFKEATGYSVMEYVNVMKVEEAKKLIREKTYNFTQISSMLLFNNPHYFSRVFRKVTGLSPREYVNSVKK